MLTLGGLVSNCLPRITIVDPANSTPAIFRAHRYALSDPRFDDKVLEPERYAELNRLIVAGVEQRDPRLDPPRGR